MNTLLEIHVEILPHGQGLALPSYATAGSAGMDLAAAIDQSVSLAPGERRLIPSGLKIAVPAGYEAQVRPRSGWAIKTGITCLNTPGTIDSDYRGEVGVILVNLGAQPVVIQRGDRIAQLVFCPVAQAGWQVVEALESTRRGAGGFGHTGS